MNLKWQFNISLTLQAHVVFGEISAKKMTPEESPEFG